MIKAFLTIILRNKKQLPLHIVLVVPFIVQIFVAVTLTGWLSLRNSQKSVNQLVTELETEVSDRINQHLDSYLLMPELANQAALNVMELELVSHSNNGSLERFFWQQIYSEPRINTIQFGSEEGNFIGSGYWNDGKIVIKKADDETNNEFHTYYTNEKGELTDLINSSPNYDPRKRPWYQKAAQEKKAVWSPIYAMKSHGFLGMTLSEPIYDDQEQLLGVLGTDILLSEISNFLNQLKIGKTGQAFIIERSGEIIASSTDVDLFQDYQGDTKRINAINSSDRMIQLTTEYLKENFSNFNDIQNVIQIKEDIAQENYFVQITPFKHEKGLDWLIITVIPHEDFTEKINHNKVMTVALCIIALIIASIIGLITSNWVAFPIRQLSFAALSLSEGKWEAIMPNTDYKNSSMIEEVYQLFFAFNQMRKQLQQSFIDLKRGKLELEKRVKERTNALQNANHNLRTEIVERNRAEIALRNSENKFRNLFENSQVGIFRTRISDGLFLDANECCVEILGYNCAEEMIKILKANDVYVDPKMRNQVLKEIEEEGEVQNFETQFYRKDGSVLWVLFSGRVNKIDNCLEGVITDISDRKKAEAALKENEEYLRLIINNIPQQIFWKDRNLVFLGCNKNWAKAAEIDDPDSVIGKTDFDFFRDPQVAEHFRELDQKIMDDDTPQLHIIAKKQRPSSDGNVIWLDINKIPIHDHNGNVIGILGVLDDITERKLAQEALRAEQEKSEKLLLNILPKVIADKLKEDDSEHIAEQFDNVTILFADIVGFTTLSSQLSPRELVDILNEIFSTFDQLLEKHNLEKIKTIGDAYMIVGGLPVARKNHAHAIANMALDMIEEISNFQYHCLYQDIKNQYNCPNLQIRIGINTGSVVAGVIGMKKFIYDLWGDTVNVASRMESQGEPGKIQITHSTYEELKNDYILETRGIINVKGKGEMPSYWLLGKKE